QPHRRRGRPLRARLRGAGDGIRRRARRARCAPLATLLGRRGRGCRVRPAGVGATRSIGRGDHRASVKPEEPPCGPWTEVARGETEIAAAMRYLVLACDYDGTLAHHGVVDAATVAGLDRLLSSGRRLLLVTRRQLPDLTAIFPEIDRFELVLAENG